MLSLITIIFSSIIITTWLNFVNFFWWFYYTGIILTTWLNFVNFFWWFCYTATKDLLLQKILLTKVFVWFYFLFCINCSHLLSVLIILEVYLTICLELKSLIILILLLLHHLLVLAWKINLQTLLSHLFLIVTFYSSFSNQL